MQKIDNYNFKGKKVIVRVDFNVPLNKEFLLLRSTQKSLAFPHFNLQKTAQTQMQRLLH